MISRNLRDQLTQNFKYAFSTRVIIQPLPESIEKFYFLYLFRPKSIIKLQSIATFLIADLFLFFLVLATAKLIPIKGILTFFHFRQAEWPESWTPFLKAAMFQSMQCH